MSEVPEDRGAAVGRLGLQLGHLLAEARGYLQGVAEAVTPPVSPAGFSVLQWLHAHGATRASDLADALAMDRSALSRLARQLQTQGLVATETAMSDGRGVVLALTPAAEIAVGQAMSLKAAAFEARLADWSAADLSLLAGLLERLNENGARR